MPQQNRRDSSCITGKKREGEQDRLEVTDWRVRIRWFSQYTDNTIHKCQQWPEYSASRHGEAAEKEKTHGQIQRTRTHTHTGITAVSKQTTTYLSLSTLLKPGRMCLKLELRSSLGWLLVRFIEPFSRRLRKPWRRETETVNKTVSLQVCEGSLQDASHSAQLGSRTEHINTNNYASHS